MKPSTIPAALVAFAAVCLLTPQLSRAQASIPEREHSATITPTAIEKVRTLPVTEQTNTKAGTTYTVEVEVLRGIAPELLQERKETVPSPHARMPHMTTQKVVHSVDYAAMMPLLLKAIQEQQGEIERLRNELSLLKAQARK
jgi:hypothetical protein